MSGAVLLVSTTAGAQADLSPASRACLSIWSTSIGEVLGAELTQQAIASMTTSIATSLGLTGASVFAGVGAAIPFIKEVLAVAMVIVNDILSKEEAKARQKEEAKNACIQAEARWQPWGTGSNGAILPCDIFAEYNRRDVARLGIDWNDTADQPRSTLGETLIWLTEGRHNARKLELARQRFGEQNYPRSLGIPPERVALFRALRVAMAAQREHEPRGSTDGGTTLWPIYLDLLQAEVRRHTITQASAKLLLSTYEAQGGVLNLMACHATAGARVQMLWGLLERWENTKNPWYGQPGAAAEAERAAIAMARAYAGERRIRIPLGKKKGATYSAPRPKAPAATLPGGWFRAPAPSSSSAPSSPWFAPPTPAPLRNATNRNEVAIGVAAVAAVLLATSK